MKYLKRFTLVGLCAIVTLLSTKTNAQEFSAGINTETPNPNAVLHLVAPNGNQGLLIPSLTTGQRTSMTLSAADNGLMVFDSDDNAFYFWVNPNWVLTTNTDNQNLANVLGQGNDAGGATIENVADPVNPQDVATRNYVDNQGDSDDQDLELTGNTLSLTNDPTSIDLTPFLDNTDNQNLSSVLASGNDAGAITITNLPTPVNPADVATKGYVDSNAGLTTVTSADIVDGEIANADINAGANISWNKIDKTGANVSEFTNDLGFIDNAANPTALDVSGSFGTGLQVDQVGGATAGDVASATAIVNGNPNLDLDSTDDLDLTTVPNGAGDITGDFGTGLFVDLVGGADAADVAGATAIVLGSPNLDLDSTDDLDLTTVPNAGGDIIGDFGSGLIIDADAVTSTEIQDGSIVDADVSDVAANKITYDNTTSLLTAIDVQAAIDEIDGTVDGLGTPAANLVTFNNVASGLTATDVQGAIDEIDATIDAGDLTDDQTGAEVTFNNVASGLTATDVQGAIDEIDATIDAGDLTDDQTGAEVTFNNVASGLSAVNVQAAIDEIDGTVDGLGTPAANVVTFNNVASGLTATDVQGAIDEIDATIDAGDLTDDQTGAEVTFNNVASGLTATDVQGAIDEIDATIDAGDLTDDQTGAEVTFNNVASGLTATDVQGAIDEIDATIDAGDLTDDQTGAEVTFNNVASGLTATDVQGAIDEIDATIDAGDLTDDQTGAEVTFNNVASGLSAVNVQAAIDEIDGTVDGLGTPAANVVTFNNVASGLTATDVQGAIDEIDATIDAGDLTDDQTGAEVTFNNVVSGLTATDVQGAIDEIDATIDAGDLTDDQTGAEVTFNNVASGLSAVNVQAAIDEIDGTVDGLGTAASTTFNNVASGLTATDVQGAIDEIDATIDAGDLTDDQTGAEVTFNNVASGLSAVNVQAAIDEIDGTVDGLGTAASTTFNNVASGLTATDVQGAIDEIDATIDAGDLTDDQTGAEVTFNNVASGLSAVNVQAAIDEIDGTVDGLGTAASTTFNNVASGLTATDVQGAIDEIDATIDAGDLTDDQTGAEVSFNNVASGLSAVNVQAAIDEIDGTVDGLGTAASTTFNNVASGLTATDVQGAIDEIDATIDAGDLTDDQTGAEVTFNNVASGLTATDVQGAIDEIDATIDAGDLTDDQTGAEVTFNNVASGLTATDVQGAIDEIDATIDAGDLTDDQTGAEVTFNNVASGLSAVNVQAAIDEIDGTVDGLGTAASTTFNNVASGLTATDVQGAIDEIDATIDAGDLTDDQTGAEVTFNNVASGLSAVNVQAAIDEIDATIDAGDLTDDQTGAEVTFNNVASGLSAVNVQAAIDEIDGTVDGLGTAASTTFNNVASGLTATDVQGAIDEIDATIDAGDLTDDQDLSIAGNTIAISGDPNSDVDLAFSPPADGEVLTWDNTNTRWDALAVPVTGDMFAAVYDPGGVLGDAFDLSNHITFTAPIDGDVLTWDNTNSRWDAIAVPVTGDMFAAVYDPGGVLGDAFDLSNHITITAPIDGDVLTWDNTNSRWDAIAPSPVLNSGNGVTINTNNIDLGGALTAPAIITTGAGSNDLTINGAGRFISNTAIETSLNSPLINLGDAATDDIRVNGEFIFEAGANDLTLVVAPQANVTPILRIPDLPSSDETLALQSDIGNVVTGSANRIPKINASIDGLEDSDLFTNGVNNQLTVQHTATSIPDFVIHDAGTGDASMQFNRGGAAFFSMGVDFDDSDNFKISSGTNVASNEFVIDRISGNVGLGTSTPAVAFDINATDAMRVPKGNDLERPTGLGAADAGLFRYSDETGAEGFEGYDGTAWKPISGVDFQMGFIEDAANVVFGANVILPAPSGKAIQVIDDNVGGGALIASSTFSNDLNNNRTGIAMLAARGNSGAPGALQTNDLIGELVFNGHYGGGLLANFDQGASIEVVAANGWSSGNTGADMIFSTTAVGSSGPQPRLEIENSGQVSLIGDGSISNQLIFNDADGSDDIRLQAPDIIGGGNSYTLILPDAQGTGSLTNDGAGNLTWAPSAGFATPSFDNANNLIIGSSVSTEPLFAGNDYQLGVTSPSGTGKAILSTHNYGGIPEMRLQRTNGSLGGESGVAANDVIGEIAFSGRETGGTYPVPASIRAEATDAYAGGSALGTDIVFSATPSGTTAALEVMRIKDGFVGINNNAPNVELDVIGDVEVSGSIDIGTGNVSMSNAGNIAHRGNMVSIPDATVRSGVFTVNHRVIRLNGNVPDLDPGLEGQEVILLAVAGLTVTHGGAISLNGSTDFVMTPNSTLHLLFDGTNWLEIGRSQP